MAAMRFIRRTIFIALAAHFLTPAIGRAQSKPAAIHFKFEQTPLSEALDQLMRQHDLKIVFMDKDIEGIKVSADCENCTDDEALNRLLRGTALRWRKEHRIIVPDSRAIITGKVMKADSHAPLENVSLLLKDTKHGTVSDSNGTFIIPNVPPGEYTLIATLLGRGLYTKKISLAPGDTISVKFVMQEKSIPLQEVIVISKADEPLSAQVFDAGMIEQMVADDLIDAVTLNSAITASREGGALSNDETGESQFITRGGVNDLGFMVDGMTVRDPISGGLGLLISTAAIKEIQLHKGHFEAEYGNAMSGILNVVTREGDSTTSFKFRGLTDALSGKATRDYTFAERDRLLAQKGRLDRANWVTNQAQFSLGGSVAGNKLRYFVAGEYFETDGYVGVLQNEFVRLGTAKLTYLPSPRHKFTLMANGFSENQGIYGNDAILNNRFSYAIFIFGGFGDYIFNNRLDTRTYQGLAAWTCTLNANAFFNFKLQYLTRRLHFARMGARFPRIDSVLTPVQKVDSSAADQSDRLWQAKFDLTWQAHDHHSLKTGVELTFRRIWHNRPNYIGGVSTVTPIEAAVYLQNWREYKKFTVSAGIRLDYFNPKVPGIDEKDSLGIGELEKFLKPRDNGGLRVGFKNPVDPKLRLSPRLSLTQELWRRSKFYLAYGLFYQIPQYNNNYYSLFINSTFNRFIGLGGNLNFEPEKTIAYEIGWLQGTTGGLAWSLIGFYNDRDFNNIFFADFSRTRGIEINLRTRRFSHFASYVSYTFSRSKIKYYSPASSSIFDVFQHKASWEQPHVFNFNLDFRYGKNEGPRLGQTHVLENLGVNLTARSQSGFLYTPIAGSTLYDQNSARRPFIWQIDLRVEKLLFMDSNIKWSFFTEILNLTNRRNVIEVSHYRGASRDQQYIRDFERNPYHVGPQRNIRLGLQVER